MSNASKLYIVVIVTFYFIFFNYNDGISACKDADSFDVPVLNKDLDENHFWNVPFNYFGNYFDDMGGYHSGEDWNAVGKSPNADLGKPVRAIANGQVVKIYRLNKLGYLIALQHTTSSDSSFCIKAKNEYENGQFFKYSSKRVTSIYSIYIHLDDNLAVKENDCVEKGEILGFIMDPGGGPHLHFEIRSNDAINSKNWSLVGEETNWAYNKDKTPTGYYLNVQIMVDSGLLTPRDFISTNKKLGDAECDEQHYSKKGLYYGSRKLAMTNFEVNNRYFVDGAYKVSSSPNILRDKKTFTFHLVPNRSAYFFGADEWVGSATQVKRGFHIYEVQDNGLFVVVRNRKKIGHEINYNVITLSDKVIKSNKGFVQRRSQLLKINVSLDKGEYFFFEGEGTVFDKETFPIQKQGGWYIEVVDY